MKQQYKALAKRVEKLIPRRVVEQYVAIWGDLESENHSRKNKGLKLLSEVEYDQMSNECIAVWREN